ncbi:hypothetical protein [Paraburkholderia rhynchosiae]|uniref:Uncharacterized protein n=1 Tax=Paraburkholderia rhynchosiae TaxID=487049 RepID=A0A2N7WD37_9BURK|nr:hypothetical protein [Paraburkholderia rhynchosiae]PMS27313.1 hypothetical protein C0Z16_25135 [Paraburkholderia rhynchosiae]CAB3744316.1 hypothetical protein LMG27174_07155 [Paraburkholderia rhynchosiae]
MAKILVAMCICFAYSGSSFGAGFLADIVKQDRTVADEVDKANSQMGNPVDGDVARAIDSVIPGTERDLGALWGKEGPQVTGMPITGVPKCCPKK